MLAAGDAAAAAGCRGGGSRAAAKWQGKDKQKGRGARIPPPPAFGLSPGPLDARTYREAASRDAMSLAG